MKNIVEEKDLLLSEKKNKKKTDLIGEIAGNKSIKVGVYMKRVGLLIGSIVILIVLGMIFYSKMTDTKVLHISREDVTRIYIVDGNTGNITDVEENYFGEMYEAIDSLKLSNKMKVDSTGWNKKIVICGDNNAEELVINTPTKIILSGYFYDIDSEQGEKIMNIINKFSK